MSNQYGFLIGVITVHPPNSYLLMHSNHDKKHVDKY